MQLVTYQLDDRKYLGVKTGKNVIDLKALSSLYKDKAPALSILPTDMLSFIQQGEKALTYVRTLIEWFETNKDAESSVTHGINEVQLLAPILNPGKVICVGNNYMDHCREQNVEPPKKPMIFSKWASCIIGPNETIVLPSDSQQVDYEAELVVVIGKEGKEIPEAEALDYVFGYTIMNDVSARDVQFEDVQWVRGKSYDTFAPLGPAIVTADEIEDPQNLTIKLDINGQVLQDSNTSFMIFDIPYLVSYLSKGFTLKPGDILATGTPHGVGVFRNPPIFLKHGDVCTIELEKLGVLTNSIN